MDDVDVWVGGILETKDGPGELFKTVIIDQFTRIRDADRFWFENTDNGYVVLKYLSKTFLLAEN